MNEHLDSAMKALAGAAAARRLYFAGHPAVRAGVERAAGDLEKFFAQQGEAQVEVHAIDDRVVGPTGPLADAAALRAGLFDALLTLGRPSLRVSRGVSADELGAFVEGLAGETPEVRASGRIVAGAAGVAVGAADVDESGPVMIGTGAASVGGLVDKVKSVWSAAAAENFHVGADGEEMESVVRTLVAAAFGARGTVLEIAHLKAHDEYTFVHTVNVALLSAALAEAVGLGSTQVHEVTQAALLHDLGKRVIPLSILNKQGQLTPEERTAMQRHPIEGARLLMGRARVPTIAPIVAFEHHMHLDGSGYPVSDKRWRPHLASQIVQQADVFDALRTNRPYRAAMSTEKASAILQEGSGTKYDSALVSVFLQRVVTRTKVIESPTGGAAETRAAA